MFRFLIVGVAVTLLILSAQEQRPDLQSQLQRSTALSKLKRQVGKQSVAAERSMKGRTARDSLAHISVNLPEAPAFRHMHFRESVLSNCTDSQPQDGSVLGLSHPPASSTDHVGPSVMMQSHGGQARHSSVTLSLPESPKKKIARAHSLSQRSYPGFSHGTTCYAGPMNRPDTAMKSLPPAEGLLANAPQAIGLFLAALLDTGPPRLSPTMFDSLSGQDASHNSTADADRLNCSAGPSVMMSQMAGHRGNSVELSLRQSDFSR